MRDVDEFSRALIEEAKRFYEKALLETDAEGKYAYLHASLLLGFSALEAHVNGIAEDFLVRTDLGILERSILAEEDFKLEDGEFKIHSQLKMYRLEDRIEFLYRKFSSVPIDKDFWWWRGFKSGINLRNRLVHPKESPILSEPSVKNALEAILETLNVLYKVIYGSPYPVAKRGLQSTMKF